MGQKTTRLHALRWLKCRSQHRRIKKKAGEEANLQFIIKGTIKDANKKNQFMKDTIKNAAKKNKTKSGPSRTTSCRTMKKGIKTATKRHLNNERKNKMTRKGQRSQENRIQRTKGRYKLQLSQGLI